MKKIIATILLLAMALCLCACGDKNVEARYVGTWQTQDKTATLTLNADGTAALEITGENAGSYELKWTAQDVTNMTLSWAGTPVPAVKDAEEDTTDEVEDQVTDEAVTDEAATEEEVIDVDIPVEDAAASDDAAATATTGSTRKNDPSVVGFGSIKIIEGGMWLGFAEGSSEDILLFTYAFEKIA